MRLVSWASCWVILKREASSGITTTAPPRPVSPETTPARKPLGRPHFQMPSVRKGSTPRSTATTSLRRKVLTERKTRKAA